MQRLSGQELAGTGVAFDGQDAEVRRGAAHAGEKLLHRKAAAHHGAQGPLFRLQSLRFKSSEVGWVIDGEGPGGGREEVMSESNGAIGNHSTVHFCLEVISAEESGTSGNGSAREAGQIGRTGAIPQEQKRIPGVRGWMERPFRGLELTGSQR